MKLVQRTPDTDAGERCIIGSTHVSLRAGPRVTLRRDAIPGRVLRCDV